MIRSRLATILVVAAAACGDRGPPVWAPNPIAAGPPSEACARARSLRARAPGLLQEGRLDRTARALSRAEDLCPPEAPAGWALRVRALAALGRSTEALQLAARIEVSDRASDADRSAAAAARVVCEQHGRAIAERGSRRDAPELFDPADRRRAEAGDRVHRAAAASRAGDHASAEKLFLEAWDAWHPDPGALVEAGLEARAQGKRAEAQTLWDRAAYDDATIALRPVVPSGAPAFHADPSIAWSRAGDRVAVSGDRIVEVFDTELRLTLHLVARDVVTAVAFGVDAGRLYVAIEGGAVQVFDVLTGLPLRDLSGHRAAVRAIATSALVATAGDDGTVGLWSADGASLGFAPARPAGSRDGVAALAFDATGGRLAAAADDGHVALFRAADGGLSAVGSLSPHGGPVRALAFGAGDGELSVVTTGERVTWDFPAAKLPHPTTVARTRSERASIVVADARTIVASLVGADLDVRDLAARDAYASTRSTLHGGLAAFALAPSGGTLAAVYRDRTLALLPATGRGEARELTPSGPVDGLAVSAERKIIAAAAGGRVLVWRATGERLHEHEPGVVRALALSPDGRTLAMGLDDGHVDLRDLEGRSADRFLGAAGPVASLAFSADGARLAACTRAPSVQIFATGATSDARSLQVAAGPVNAARFSPDGASVIVASKDGLTLWSPGAREGLRFVPYGPEVRDAAFSPDGSAMIVIGQRGALLFGKPAANAPAPAQTVPVPAQALALAVGKDGTIVTAEGDRSITLRSPQGKALQRFHDADAAIRGIALLPSHAVAGLADGSVRLYRAPETGPVAILRAAPGLPAGKVGGIVTGPRGHLEIVGPDLEAAGSRVRCMLGAVAYPLDVCAEQYAVEGMLPMVLAGKDPAEADP